MCGDSAVTMDTACKQRHTTKTYISCVGSVIVWWGSNQKETLLTFKFYLSDAQTILFHPLFSDALCNSIMSIEWSDGSELCVRNYVDGSFYGLIEGNILSFTWISWGNVGKRQSGERCFGGLSNKVHAEYKLVLLLFLLLHLSSPWWWWSSSSYHLLLHHHHHDRHHYYRLQKVEMHSAEVCSPV